MAGFLGKVLSFLNRDVTGRTWQREVAHPYFKQLIYFGATDPAKCYWEAQLAHPLSGKAVAITMQGTRSWSRTPWPESWRDAFELDGFSVPRHGDPGHPWEATYFVRSAGHYFTAHFEASGDVRFGSMDSFTRNEASVRPTTGCRCELNDSERGQRP